MFPDGSVAVDSPDTHLCPGASEAGDNFQMKYLLPGFRHPWILVFLAPQDGQREQGCCKC